MNFMKKKFALIIFTLCSIFISFSQVKNLDLRDKVVNLSTFTKVGHVTAFVFSIYGCIPCEKLLIELTNRYSKDKNFDIYHCNIGNKEDVRNWNTFKKKPVPTYWSQVERIYEFPTLYIYSPAGNLSYKYSDIDAATLEEIKSKIDYLLNNLEYFNNLSASEKLDKAASTGKPLKTKSKNNVPKAKNEIKIDKLAVDTNKLLNPMMNDTISNEK